MGRQTEMLIAKNARLVAGQNQGSVGREGLLHAAPTYEGLQVKPLWVPEQTKQGTEQLTAVLKMRSQRLRSKTRVL